MPTPAPRHFHVSPEGLLADLHRAYLDARRHKRGKECQLRFEYRLEDNLAALRDEILAREYEPRPSTCFVIHDPKMREVFAADFRDRIVHHLFHNYTHALFERTFIADSYSCIEGRGTHYGIERLKHHIRSVSAGYSRPAYVLKVDISGYFMHIDRRVLLSLCRATLARMMGRPSTESGRKWRDLLDGDLVDYLLETIVTSDPTRDCRRLGDPAEWDGLPAGKSLFHSPDGCGLPIGNLSSQMFSNVYMNAFDQFAKRDLGCRHYGRYVDDCFVVDGSRERLWSLVPRMEGFLREVLRLEMNMGKLRVTDVRHGVEFLGAYVMPFRTYVSNGTLDRMRRKLRGMDHGDPDSLGSSVNSYLGVLSHYDSYRLRRVLFGHSSGLGAYGRFSPDWLGFRPFGR